jgi:hypothetical protein
LRKKGKNIYCQVFFPKRISIATIALNPSWLQQKLQAGRTRKKERKVVRSIEDNNLAKHFFKSHFPIEIQQFRFHIICLESIRNGNNSGERRSEVGWKREREQNHKTEISVT